MYVRLNNSALPSIFVANNQSRRTDEEKVLEQYVVADLSQEGGKVEVVVATLSDIGLPMVTRKIIFSIFHSLSECYTQPE
jgi:hypothetical protein